MGSDDEPVDFESLTMMDKLELFYSLCEWQFHNPNSLRSRMRDDDELANWVDHRLRHSCQFPYSFTAYTAYCLRRQRERLLVDGRSVSRRICSTLF
jgi:hypothetical protein